MSIVTLFDKSFLQSLSLDEAVLFDNFFISDVCPVFYVEILADLDKDVRKRTPDEEVRILATKFPELHGAPSAYHKDLCTGELLGERVPTKGQLPIAQGVAVRADGQIQLFIEHLGIDRAYHHKIVGRLTTLNFPELSRYAPYSAHVLMVELFFRVALASDLISNDRPSNWVDIAYLFYLPFCAVFVSSGKLHWRCAPLLLDDKQEFVRGPDLKEGLRELNVHCSAYPGAVRNEGLMRFAGHPPAEGNYLVAQPWDRHAPRWRTRQRIEVGNDTEKLEKLGERIHSFREATPVHDSALSGTSPDFVFLE